MSNSVRSTLIVLAGLYTAAQAVRILATETGRVPSGGRQAESRFMAYQLGGALGAVFGLSLGSAVFLDQLRAQRRPGTLPRALSLGRILSCMGLGCVAMFLFMYSSDLRKGDEGTAFQLRLVGLALCGGVGLLVARSPRAKVVVEDEEEEVTEVVVRPRRKPKPKPPAQDIARPWLKPNGDGEQ
jgi:hypothetical protein